MKMLLFSRVCSWLFDSFVKSIKTAGLFTASSLLVFYGLMFFLKPLIFSVSNPLIWVMLGSSLVSVAGYKFVKEAIATSSVLPLGGDDLVIMRKIDTRISQLMQITEDANQKSCFSDFRQICFQILLECQRRDEMLLLMPENSQDILENVIKIVLEKTQVVVHEVVTGPVPTAQLKPLENQQQTASPALPVHLKWMEQKVIPLELRDMIETSIAKWVSKQYHGYEACSCPSCKESDTKIFKGVEDFENDIEEKRHMVRQTLKILDETFVSLCMGQSWDRRGGVSPEKRMSELRKHLDILKEACSESKEEVREITTTS